MSLKRRNMLRGVGLMSVAALLTGCVVNNRPPEPTVVQTPPPSTEVMPAPSTEVIVPSAPPAPRVEVIPPARQGMRWHPGHWEWNGSQYVWLEGQWVAAPSGGADWVPGHWVQRANGWVWIEGHWRG
jgi:hypothetical protein